MAEGLEVDVAGSDGTRNPFEGFRVEIDPEKLDDAVRELRDRILTMRGKVEEGVALGRYTKVRIHYKGRPISPDLPLSAFLAGQGVALVAIGPLYTVLANLAGRAVLDVRFVHEAEEWVTKGQRAWQDGEPSEAESAYREALRRRADDPGALYGLAVILRVTGRREEALQLLRRAVLQDPEHPDVVRASELLRKMEGKRRL